MLLKNSLHISVFVALGATLLSSCGSGSSNPQPTAHSQSVEDVAPTSISDVQLDQSIIELDPDAPLIVNIPELDLTIEYSSLNVRRLVATDYIASQWESLSDCLGLNFETPYIFVNDGWIEPADVDDVLFSIDGRRVATSTLHTFSKDSIHISSFDFDGSQGNPGFHLRSILGRYLWTMSGNPIRDYNTGCASG